MFEANSCHYHPFAPLPAMHYWFFCAVREKKVEVGMFADDVSFFGNHPNKEAASMAVQSAVWRIQYPKIKKRCGSAAKVFA